MSDTRRDLVIRLGICIPLVAATGFTIARASEPNLPFLLLGFPCVAVCAVVLMPNATGAASEHVRELLDLEHSGSRYLADLDAADALIDAGDLDGARRRLLETARAHPRERAAWMRLFHLTLVRMNRPDLAADALQAASELGLSPRDREMVLWAYQLFAEEVGATVGA
ncbi:hypothetical protein KDM41_16235 [bacterium]|nr:hypothetical protein [bacterium]